ncbi:dephospho-CoA kinase [Leucothrix arctica]|uniref:Dephospho-CoA kinase n=1 Tax=Leucothrix arctica TaxID=1481894 RepID=A0A317CQB4_9GAMM|nr:dephospho-CoA kinase [Leucothrix arctica]PWQ99713.1 dephospho-CoA kinase [Leucothrix arctica]
MLKVGLTGGIGSGKSTVAKVLQAKGITLVDADKIAREVVQPGELALQEVAEAFGSDILLADGNLDRTSLKQRIFSDPLAKTQLESILHPRIRQRILERVEEATDTPYVVADIPLLVENNYPQYFDRVIVVDCPEEIQIARVQARDEMSKAQILNIMASQATRKDRNAAATDIIDNSGDLASLKMQIEKLHESLLSLL